MQKDSGEKLDNLPDWLEKELFSDEIETKRDEIEVKFVVNRELVLRHLDDINCRKQEIEQYYTDIVTLRAEISEILPQDQSLFHEWRVRKNNAQFFVTGKSSKGSNVSRKEFQAEILKEQYEKIKSIIFSRENVASVIKTRRSFEVALGQQEVLVEVDDFHEAAGKKVQLDFVYCEIEVSDIALARSIQKCRISHSTLKLFISGVEVSQFNEFKNAKLAARGFPSTTFKGTSKWVRDKLKEQFAQLVDNVEDSALGPVSFFLGEEIGTLETPRDNTAATNGMAATFQVSHSLMERAFTPEQSMGRPLPKSDNQLTKDAAGYGWARDFQFVVSSDPFLRLFQKPQVFRPGLGHNNTTTRGQHTLDVITTAQNLATQLGLNVGLASAIAALHDVGHPAGGHIGEEILTELSGLVFDGNIRKFKHHVFSLSLADIFDFNLLKEVQIGSYYHKSGGKKLGTPKGRPQEFGVVRIADKLSYVPWDVHDSLRNGFLKKTDIPDWVYDVLGAEPMDWVETMVTAVVEESAHSFGMSFTKKSGDVFAAYEEARNVVYGQVHKQLIWDVLKIQYRLVFDIVRRSFPNLDPIPILAYMTDDEIGRLAAIAEAHPKNKKLSLGWFKNEGMGFVDIVKNLYEIRDKQEWDNNVYYSSVERNKVHP